MAHEPEDLREFAFHRRIRAANADLGPEIEIPPGDDMAMMRFDDPRLLAAVDQCVMGRHCRLDEDLHAVGRKAVLRNLSDVAAMAAAPVATLASATLPDGTTHAEAERLFEGLRTTGARFAAPLIGGDLAMHADRAHPAVIAVTILARPTLPNDRVIRRGGSRPGDLLAVTGELGGSLDADGGGRHLDFPPRVDEAIALARTMGDGLVAMLDTSDGVATDCVRLVEAADQPIRCVLDTSAIPARTDLDWRRAISDGEDYELLFTCRTPPPERIGDLRVTVIGRVEAREPNASPVLGRIGDDLVDLSGRGWEHASPR